MPRLQQRNAYVQDGAGGPYWAVLAFRAYHVPPRSSIRPYLVSLLARRRRPGGLGAGHVSVSTPVVAASWPQRNRNASRMNGVWRIDSCGVQHHPFKNAITMSPTSTASERTETCHDRHEDPHNGNSAVTGRNQRARACA